MRRIALLPVVFISVLFSAGCSSDSRTYTDSENRFSVDFPNTWQIIPGGQTGIAVTFESPMEGLSDSFLENFSITAGAIPPEMTAKDFAEASLAAPQSYIPGFRLIEQKPVTLAGGRPHILSLVSRHEANAYLLSYEGDLAGEKLTWKQFFFVKKGMGYSIIFTLSSSCAKNYGRIVEDVSSSFHID
ncbi:MAG: PsbP-related protein [Spirochaetota bacterium]